MFPTYIDRFIHENNLKNTCAYLDNVTNGGTSQEDHDHKLNAFVSAPNKASLTLNMDRCTPTAYSVNTLRFNICHGQIRPDPERLRPLKEMPIPKNKAALQRAVGRFSYYSQWVHRFSQTIRPLVESKTFPLDQLAEIAFDTLKQDIVQAAISAVDDKASFVMETDASNSAISAALHQNGRQVAFFSRKIQRWQIELASYSYDIVYRAGTANVAADALSLSNHLFCFSSEQRN